MVTLFEKQRLDTGTANKVVPVALPPVSAFLLDAMVKPNGKSRPTATKTIIDAPPAYQAPEAEIPPVEPEPEPILELETIEAEPEPAPQQVTVELEQARAEIERARAEREKADSWMEMARADLERLEREVFQAQQGLGEAVRTAEHLRKDVSRLTDEQASLVAELTDTRGREHHARQTLQAADAQLAAIDPLREELATAVKARQAAEQALAHQTTGIAESGATHDKLREDLANAIKARQAAEQSLAQQASFIAESKAALTKLREDLANANTVRHAVEQVAAQQTTEIAAGKAALGKLREELAAELKARHTAEQVLAKFEARRDEAAKLLAARSATITELTEALQRESEVSAKRKADIEIERHKTRQLSEQLKTQHTLHLRQTQECAELHVSVEKMKAEVLAHAKARKTAEEGLASERQNFRKRLAVAVTEAVGDSQTAWNEEIATPLRASTLERDRQIAVLHKQIESLKLQLATSALADAMASVTGGPRREIARPPAEHAKAPPPVEHAKTPAPASKIPVFAPPTLPTKTHANVSSQWRVRGQSLPKHQNDFFTIAGQTVWRKNEDQVRVSELHDGVLAAIADGAGGSGLYCGAWAQSLVDHLPDEPITTPEGLNAWLSGFWADFRAQIKHHAAEDTAKLSKFVREGSFATLAACWLKKQQSGTTVRWTCYGDSAFLVFDRTGPDAVLTYCHPANLTTFQHDPHLLNWKDLPQAEHLKVGMAPLPAKATLVLASDGVGWAILMRYLANLHASGGKLHGTSRPGPNPELLGEFSRLVESGSTSRFAALARQHLENHGKGMADDLESLGASLESEESFTTLAKKWYHHGLMPNDDSSLVMIDVQTYRPR